jgi:hypothetical protein
MESKRSRSPALAGLFSALLPGLGQFYNRQWGKGAGFLGSLLVFDGLFGATADMMRFVTAGLLPPSLTKFLFGAFLILGIAIWSILDAMRTARKASQEEMG